MSTKTPKTVSKTRTKTPAKAAAKSVTKSKTVLKSNDTAIQVKELLPRDPDTKYLGSEPLFVTQPQPHLRSSTLIRSFNWYNHFYARRDARDMLVSWANHVGHANVHLLSKVSENALMPTLCWLARMNLRGLELTEIERQTLDTEVRRLIDTVNAPQQVTSTGSRKEASVKPNIQEIMRERTREAGGDLEHMFDEFIEAGTKDYTSKTIGLLTERNVQPQHISILVDSWKRKLAEYERVLEGKDRQLTEAYSHYTKTQLKNTVKFIETVIQDLSGYISIKRVQRAPRARKAVSPEKLVSKMKYLKSFAELKLESVHPSKIVGATEVWAYDTAKRKLHYYIADSHAQTLGVKGTAILGFDPVQSAIKTIRKPQEQIKEFMASGIPASRKFFKDIKTTAVAPKGRTNEALIILKVK